MSDKTYSETRDEAPFDWHQALLFPEKHDHERLGDMAASWVTCACGNQCAIIPRAVAGIEKTYVRTMMCDGEPIDGILSALGFEFADAVQNMEWGNAERILFSIEARSAILIAEELAKLNTTP